jgi:hypothetical protein
VGQPRQRRSEGGRKVWLTCACPLSNQPGRFAALETTLERLDQEIKATEDRARVQWSDMTQDARERTSGALADLRIGRNRLSQTYGALSQSAASAWGDLLAGIREDWNAIEDAWDDAETASGPETETGY